MIRRLSIRNLILIEEAEIEFGPGLNILTGETGSGKSAILSAIRLILGERSDAALIRRGAELAVVEALVQVDVTGDQDLELPKIQSPVLIRREIHSSGRSRCFVQDQQISLQQLRNLLSTSIELVDQSASQKLSDPEEQRRLLDDFLGIIEEVDACSKSYFQVQELKSVLSALLRLKEEGSKDRDRMEEDLLFLDKIDWQKGEEEKLAAEHHLLSHAQELLEKLAGISDFLSEGQAPVLPVLKRFAYQLEQLQRIEPKLQECAEGLRNACASLEESGRFIISYVDLLEADPHRLDLIEKRMAEIESFKRRFGRSYEEVEEFKVQWRDKLSKIDTLDEDITAAKLALENGLIHLCSRAKVLHEIRERGTLELSQAVLQELIRMNLPDARLSIEILEKEVSNNGADRVRWLFTANPGQPPLSLDRCASGGELSRLLLAIKIALAGKEKSSCLIFDEIDSNVGGKTAALLGEQLQELAVSCQLICVTHFVQVAKYAMDHFLVRKETTGSDALTKIARLNLKERLLEYSRMTGIV